MALQYNNFEPVKSPAGRHSIGGSLAVTAKRGMIVTEAVADNTLELATGRAGFFLTRDVVSAADFKIALEQEELYPDKGGFPLPTQVGKSAQAEHFQEVWVEGADLLDANMDASVAARAPVTTNAGKFAKLTASATQEAMGVVVKNEPAKNGAGRRFLILVTRTPKVV